MSERFLRVVLAVAIVGVGLLAVSVPAAAQAPEPRLVMGLPEQVEEGAAMALGAYLVDAAGSPIAGETIAFTFDKTFLNTMDAVEIGSATTNRSGLALIEYRPRSEGEIKITARFGGNQFYPAVKASQVVNVTPGPAEYAETSPFRVPGANVWMAASVLTIVWAVFLTALAYVWRIARAAPAAGDGDV